MEIIIEQMRIKLCFNIAFVIEIGSKNMVGNEELKYLVSDINAKSRNVFQWK